MKSATFVLTVIAKDEPGVVGRLSEAVADVGGNWEQSRMAHLAGWFVGILLVEIDEARADELTAAVKALAERGVRVVIERSEAGVTGDRRRMRVELVGQDHTGIIREVARALAARGVNVEELSTACEAAPMGGGDLFTMTAHISAPLALAVADLRGTLEALADDLMVDLSLIDE